MDLDATALRFVREAARHGRHFLFANRPRSGEADDYAGMTIPVAYAVAALVCNDPSKRWVELCNRIALFSFIFLTVGIGLGAVWAYVVLGWGGYWGWDPVENASLLSWLVAVAMVHSFTVYRKRDMMKGWALFTAMLTFVFAVLGTFITRSGIVESVHAFSSDPVSTYLFLADSNGDMALAMNDMAIYEHLTPTFLETKLTTLNAAALVVLDTNLSAESIRYLGEHCTAPLFADPVSAAKAGKLEPILGRLHTLKPNRMEAELLSGVTVTDEASLYRAADTLLAAGLQRVFLSLGADGVLAADHERKVHLHNLPARMVNTTGCGDAFMAAVARAFLDGADLETAAKRGLAASAIAMESADTINPAMSLTAVAERIQ